MPGSLKACLQGQDLLSTTCNDWLHTCTRPFGPWVGDPAHPLAWRAMGGRTAHCYSGLLCLLAHSCLLQGRLLARLTASAFCHCYHLMDAARSHHMHDEWLEGFSLCMAPACHTALACFDPLSELQRKLHIPGKISIPNCSPFHLCPPEPR